MKPLSELAADALYAVGDLLNDDEYERLAEASELEQVRYRYCHADCDDFAFVLNLVTGWPVFAVSSPRKGPLHRLVRSPEGRLLDVTGWVTEEGLKARYNARTLNLSEVSEVDTMLEEGPDCRDIIDTLVQLPDAPFTDISFLALLSKFSEKLDNRG